MLQILEAKLGPVNQDVATTLNNLALLYESWGEYEKARLLCQRLEKSSNNPGQYKHFHT